MKHETEIAVIIPTLNAAATLPATIASLGASLSTSPGAALGTCSAEAPGGIGECIVVDGGSQDGTPSVARESGARVIAAPRGRGTQLAAGVRNTVAPWLLLLHADTRLDPGWRAEATTHMRDNPGKAAYFRFALDSADPRARRLERLVAWRCRVLALPYGDQGLLIHRDTLRAAGGVKPLPLMEDVDLISRLGRARLAGLSARAVTSAAKWERDGWYRRSIRNVTCLTLWVLGVSPSRIARFYR